MLTIPKNAVGAIYPHARFVVAEHQLHEDVTAEQRQFYFFLSNHSSCEFSVTEEEKLSVPVSCRRSAITFSFRARVCTAYQFADS